jgi:hypothetical protein
MMMGKKRKNVKCSPLISTDCLRQRTGTKYTNKKNDNIISFFLEG